MFRKDREKKTDKYIKLHKKLRTKHAFIHIQWYYMNRKYFDKVHINYT